MRKDRCSPETLSTDVALSSGFGSLMCLAVGFLFLLMFLGLSGQFVTDSIWYIVLLIILAVLMLPVLFFSYNTKKCTAKKILTGF